MTRSGKNGAHTVGILGFGITGRAVCTFALRHGLAVRVSENGTLTDDDRTWLADQGVAFEERGHTERFLNRADELVLSPGVPVEQPAVSLARMEGKSTLSEVEFALRRAPPTLTIAVTGTNGKTTTVEVIAAMVRSVGRRTWVAGNIGLPLICVIEDMHPSDVLVVEMSSFQLEQSVAFRPDVGVLLNLAPDHLDRHGSMQAYADAKGRMFSHQTEQDVAVLPGPLLAAFSMGRGRRWVYDEQPPRIPWDIDDLLPHEASNLAAAVTACRAALPAFNAEGIPAGRVIEALRRPHRMERIGTVGSIAVINDSKATNPAASIAAIRSAEVPTVLMLGGRSKGAGYHALAEEIERSSVRHVVLFGEAGSELLEILRSAGVTRSMSLEQSLDDATRTGLRVAQPGDRLLLSPACASFDAYRDYVARGEAFADMVRQEAQSTVADSTP